MMVYCKNGSSYHGRKKNTKKKKKRAKNCKIYRNFRAGKSAETSEDVPKCCRSSKNIKTQSSKGCRNREVKI